MAHSPVLRTLLVAALLASYALQGLLPLVRDVAHVADHARERTRDVTFQVDRPLDAESVHERARPVAEGSHRHAPGHDHSHAHDPDGGHAHVHATVDPETPSHDHDGLAGILLGLAPELDPADELETDRPPVRVAIDVHLMSDAPLDALNPQADVRSTSAPLDRPAPGALHPPPLPPPRA
ncbi:MAG: hypothetical protein ACODAB_05300 [Gemmatimonadota bacterium]